MSKKKIIVVFIFNILFLFSCSRYLKKDIVLQSGHIKGKAVYQNKGISSAIVYVYNKSEKDYSLRLLTFSSPSDQNGNFSLELKPGTYYLMVKKTKGPAASILEKNDYFGYLGGNPVKVSAGSSVDLIINCVKNIYTSSEIGAFLNADKPGISGAVYYDDKPLDRAEVFIYLSMENDLRGPAYYSAVTDEQGRFYAPLEAGTYYIVLRKRLSSDQFGPIQAGDFFGYYEANPISLKQGEHQNVLLYALKKDAPKGSANIATTSGMTGADQTLISGKVHDLDKKPVSGVFVCLYKNDEMVGKPEYISNKTGEDGSFQINMVSGGKFYLIAKENFGAIPQPNDFIGYLSESKDHSIEITADKKLAGLEVIGEKILSRNYDK
ncbi:MAG: hypothetical protein PHX78_02290 [bacterium]|nr:hypothetical protein [bacterium]